MGSQLHQLSQRLTGRMAAILYVSGGLGTFSSVFLPGDPQMQPLGIVGVGLAAVMLGIVTWFLPWDEWSPRTSLLLVPTAFTLIALGNHFAAAEPFRYAIFFVVAFTWIGFTHRRGTSLAFAPLFVLAYVAPLLVQPEALATGIGSLVIVAPICLAVGESMAWVASRLRAAETNVSRMRSESHFRALIQNASDVIMIVDRAGYVRYESPSAARVLGRPAQAGGHLLELVHSVDQPMVQSALDELYAGRQQEPRLEFRVHTGDGATRVVEAVMQNMLHDENLGGVVVNFRDVTERKALEEQLKHQAFHDALTGLANRALFSDRVDHALSRLDRGGQAVAVLFIDLDDFKTINDSLGHEAGDRLLIGVSRRLRACLRPSDTAARLGGDEFAVLLEEVEPGEAELVARRILDALRAPVRVRRRELTMAASIGIALGQAPRHSAAELLRNADAAMYSAKERGKGTYAVFQSRMQRAASVRLQLKADLERAVEHRQFELAYQPIVEMSGGEIVGLEALLRWKHPRRGTILPDEFIALAEESGLIVPLGRWVLHEACATAVKLPARASGTPLFMSVNLSPRQLREPALVADVATAIARAGLEPQRLVLEITETVLMRDNDTTRERLRGLRRLGARIAIDDFGTGYSSLSYLRRFPVDVLKIARSFVSAMDGGGDESALLESIVMLSRALRLETVAEGVESAAQAAELSQLGGEQAQGHYYSPAVALSELFGVLQHQRLPAAGTDGGQDQAAAATPSGWQQPAARPMHDRRAPRLVARQPARRPIRPAAGPTAAD